MTRQKAQKRATRARMAKTGESYSAARRHTVKPKDQYRAEDMPQSDAAVRKNTGKGWKEWLRILDAWGAKERKHGEVVKHLMEERDVPGWWAQTVTIGFERARGMRAKHQTAAGFTVNVSKTFPIAAGTLFKAFTDTRQRNRWLDRGTVRARTSRTNKSARFDFQDGTSRVHVYFDPKARAKTTVTIMHERLSGADAVEEMRAFWKERLGELADILEAKR